MLGAGENTYISTEEADGLLQGEAGEERWKALTDEKKAGYLKTAARHIDSLRYAGRPNQPCQKMAFPRAFAEIPAAVRMAQALEALALCDTQAAYRRELQAQGVSSISLGKASESYQGVNSTASLKPLRSTEALLLLQPYLLGSGVIV